MFLTCQTAVPHWLYCCLAGEMELRVSETGPAEVGCDEDDCAVDSVSGGGVAAVAVAAHPGLPRHQ